MSEILSDDAPEARSGDAPRLTGPQAVAAAATTLFAPFAAALLSVNGAPALPVAVAALSAAPTAATAAAAANSAVRASALAWAAVPIALAAAWTAWLTSGATSPALPWVFAACASIALFGGRFGAFAAAALAAALAAGLAFAPPPETAYIKHVARDQRELIALLSWGTATLAVSAAIWAAVGAWREALPPLRHPTILARQALGRLAEDAASCALRIGADGRIVQAVGAVDRTLDLPREEVKGLPITELLHPDDAAATAAHLTAARAAAAAPRRAGEGGTTTFEPLTLRMRTRIGGYRWVEASFASAAGFPAPPKAAGGSDAMLILRERWRPLQEDLDPDNAERSAFLAQMGGTLREELTEVVGYAEIMKTELFGPLGGDRYREYARLAHDSGERLLERVEELLDLASLEGGGRLSAAEIADPTPLIDGAVRLARGQAERAGVALKADIPADAPHVRIDRRALRRVLVSLLQDAVRRARFGDTVRLRVGSEDGAIRFAALAERGAEKSDGAAAPPSEAEAARFDGEARFGRLVAQSLVERLGGVLAFHSDGDLGAASDAPTLLSEAILPLEPPAAPEAGESRARPIAPPRARPARTPAPAAAAPARAPMAGGSSVVAAPVFASEEDDEEPALSAERQTEMARRFEEDLKRERAAQDRTTRDPPAERGRAEAPEPDNGGAAESVSEEEDDVDRPLFAPGERAT